MDSMDKIVSFLVYSGISITVFLALLLSKDWKKQPSKKILAGILLNFLLVFLAMVALESGSEQWSLFALPLLVSVPFSWGPLLYFYVKSVYEPKLRFNKHFFMHFFPFFAVLGFVTGPFLLHSFSVLILPYSQYFFLLGLLIAGLGMVFLASYIYRSFKLLRYYRSLIKEHYSSLSRLDLRWVSVWVKGFFLLLLLDVLLPFIVILFPGLEKLLYLEFFFITAFIWYIGYYGINQKPVFLPEHLLVNPVPGAGEKSSREKEAAVSSVPVEANQRNSILKSNSETNDLIAKLRQVLAEEELYKDENLTLRQLAEAVGTTDKKLSELLNLNLRTNFYEYVNRYRVEAFKKMVLSGRAKEYTLLALAFEAGFSSKASFNRIFKQHTRQTPSQFKKMISE